MGYETTLIIGIAHQPCIKSDRGKWHVSEIASIDLCKSCFHSTRINKELDTLKAYFYGTNGKKVQKDLYGEELFLIDPKEALQMIKEANKINYRRYNAAIPMMEVIINSFPELIIKCILYGH